MPTSGTTAFNLDFTEIAEEAWERAGRIMRSGYDLKTARRSMNLLTIEWQNRGINMWTIETGTIPLTSGVGEYDLPADIIDVMDHVIRTGTGADQSDLTINRISSSTYSSIPNKNSEGRPVQIWVRRLRDNPKVVFWPVPNNETYSFTYWYMRRIEDAGNGVETADANFRFLPALVAGLAYQLSMKDPDLMVRTQMLKSEYEQQFQLAGEQDREKATLRLVPYRG